MDAQVQIGISGNNRLEYRTGTVNATASCRGQYSDQSQLVMVGVEAFLKRQE